MRKALRTAAVSIIVLLVMCTVVSVQAQAPDNGQGNANIIAQNMDTNTGNPDATVVVSYLNPDGTEADSTDVTVPPLAAKEFAISETSIGEPWVGSAILYSDSQLASAVILLYEGGASPDAKTAAAYTGFAETSDIWYLPLLFVKPDRDMAQISVQNADDEVATVCIRYYQRDHSVPTTEVCEDIEVGGSRYYDLGTPGGYVPDLPALIGWPRWSGSAVVEAQGGKQITVVLLNQATGSRTMAHQGIKQPSATLIAPRVHRRAYAGASGLRWDKYGLISLQNPNDATATFDLSFYSASGGTLDLQFEDLTMGPYGRMLINLQEGTDVPVEELEPLDSDPGPDIIWAGAAVVESDIPICGLVMPDFQPTGAASYYVMVDPAEGSNTLYAPAMYRVACGSRWCPYSRLSAVNLSPDFATTEFYFYDRNGEMDLHLTRGMNGNELQVINMSRTETDPLGDNWVGSLYVTSTKPIAAFVDVMWTETFEQGTYNAIND